MEVKYRELSQPIIPRSFHGFIEKYQPKRCMVINKNLKATVHLKGSEILFLTIWDLIQEDILQFWIDFFMRCEYALAVLRYEFINQRTILS